MRFPLFLTAGVQLLCWIAALWQWLSGVEDPRIEGEKLIYRS